jgi:putative SOS response-associated peptidase YedK
MCGRYAIQEGRFTRIEAALSAEFPGVEARFNVAPTQLVPVIRVAAAGGFELVSMRWGLIPAWSKEPKTPFATFNARVETVTQKPAFRGAFQRRRCLLPASGFFEWQQTPAGKQPFYFSSTNGEELALAGLWESWEGGADAPLLSCTILVGEPNAQVAAVHDRMAAILPMESLKTWLAPDTAPSELLALARRPFPAEALQVWPVDPAVGNVRNQGAHLTRPREGT